MRTTLPAALAMAPALQMGAWAADDGRKGYDLPGNIDMSLRLFGLRGGHFLTADARSWPRGGYVLRLQADGRSLSRRIVISR